MSQTETLLLVVLGFALATLIALFLGRLLWAAALKLGARRMQKQVPTTLVGLQTERDRLRAEYAMLSQRLGVRLENAKLRMAEQMAEVSRHRNRLEALESEKQINMAEIAGLKEQVSALTAQLADSQAVQAQLQQALRDQQVRRQHELTQDRHHRELEAESASLLADGEPERRLRGRIERLNLMAQTVALDRAEPQDDDFGDTHEEPPEPLIEAPSDPLIIAKLKDAEQETNDLQKELEKLDAEWSSRLDQMTGPEEASGASNAQNQPPVANVISLANRIRDLKKGLGTI